jgi:DNA-binding Lrp family transcriptional regulator
MTELDRFDRSILSLLQGNARMANTELAERVGLSPSACLRRVQRLEKVGIIAGYVALLDPQAVGRASTVFVEVTLHSQTEEALAAFEQAVGVCSEVQECHLVAGDFDYLLRVAVQDMQEYERVYKRELARLPHVARVRGMFALRTVARRTDYPL